MRKPVIWTLMLLAAAVIAAGCGEQPAAPDEPMPAAAEPTPTAAAEPTPTSAAEPEGRLIEVRASTFQFEPGTIQLQPGETVTVRFTSQDVTHTFTSPQLGLNVRVSGGDSTTVTFTAEGEGSFTFFCDVPGHRGRGMEGQIVVGEGGAQQAPAEEPTAAPAGQEDDYGYDRDY